MGCPMAATPVGPCDDGTCRYIPELPAPTVQECGTCRFYQQHFPSHGNCAIRLPAWVDDTQLSRAVADVHRCDLWRERG